MQTFPIEITQTLTTVQEISANTLQEAMEKANKIIENDTLSISEYQLVDAHVKAQKGADNVIYFSDLGNPSKKLR